MGRQSVKCTADRSERLTGGESGDNVIMKVMMDVNAADADQLDDRPGDG